MIWGRRLVFEDSPPVYAGRSLFVVILLVVLFLNVF
jgi:hypothetical protein